MAKRVETFDGVSGRFYYHVKAGNNKVTEQSQGYKFRWTRNRAAKKLAAALNLPLVDVSK